LISSISNTMSYGTEASAMSTLIWPGILPTIQQDEYRSKFSLLTSQWLLNRHRSSVLIPRAVYSINHNVISWLNLHTWYRNEWEEVHSEYFSKGCFYNGLYNPISTTKSSIANWSSSPAGVYSQQWCTIMEVRAVPISVY
jgi:hypothetical protein